MKADIEAPTPTTRPQTPTVHSDAGDAPHGLLWIDRQGRILDGSEGTEALFGYRAEQLSGLPVTTLLPDLGHIELMKDGTVNPEFAFRCRCGVSFRAAHQDGSELHCSLFASQAYLPEGQALRLIIRCQRA